MKGKPVHEGPHKYYRFSYKDTGTLVFRCAVPGCTHFVYEALILNRHSICWKCDKPFIITPKTLRVKKFHCVDCVDLRLGGHKRKAVPEQPPIVNTLVDEILLFAAEDKEENVPDELLIELKEGDKNEESA